MQKNGEIYVCVVEWGEIPEHYYEKGTLDVAKQR